MHIFPKFWKIKIKAYLPTHFSEKKTMGNKLFILWCLKMLSIKLEAEMGIQNITQT